MSTLFNDDPFDASVARKALVLLFAASTTMLIPLFVWPHLLRDLLKTDFLPHLFCYLRNPALIWTHVISDTLIGCAYFAISVTLAYLIYRTRRDIPFHWMFLAFGLFIIACGGTHFMEVVTVWVPLYVFSGVVKVFTALASVTTAVLLPFTVPRILTLVRNAKFSQEATARLRANEERKEALLREVHHRVKNNLAVICSIFYLQSTHTPLSDQPSRHKELTCSGFRSTDDPPPHSDDPSRVSSIPAVVCFRCRHL